MKFFQYLKSPSMENFSGFLFTLAWFLIQPFYLGVGELYTVDMFAEWGEEFTYVGFEQERIFNIIVNTLYNFYMISVGAIFSTVDLEATSEPPASE
mmetsp:Transcript_17529/g.29563  ORF Transcript_17529/g.29563 Transcript_17529/m.29563 type:complete len:96 (+) Transcript_17529:491-778(+)